MAAATVGWALVEPVVMGARVIGVISDEPVGARIRVRDGWLHSLVALGANAMPVATTSDSRRVLAEVLTAGVGGRRRGVASLVGPRAEVLDLWHRLAGSWGPAREVRAQQPLLALARAPLVRPDPRVRPLRAAEVDLLVPAATAMFREEVGVEPATAATHGAYRERLAQTVRAGWAFARVDDGSVTFKAEVGALAHGVCQIQGVWVAAHLRGQGVGTAAMAAVVLACQRRIAPVVSLYVNDYNRTARAMYERVGFSEVGQFATVLL
ncbi:MAG: GNAT family N-acetyltransferase [Actinomycetales bacterium]|nr:GNAT family N-acetyltransferase [Actinomycetales bacterium]